MKTFITMIFCLFTVTAVAAPIHDAVVSGDADRVTGLIQNGSDVNGKDMFGWTPLHRAVDSNRYGIATYLVLSAKADVNIRDEDWNTPLHIDAKKGNVKLVELLVDQGAVTTAKNKAGQTPKDIATELTFGKAVAALNGIVIDLATREETIRRQVYYIEIGGIPCMVYWNNGIDCNWPQ